jgi:hypothetical protein
MDPLIIIGALVLLLIVLMIVLASAEQRKKRANASKEQTPPNGKCAPPIQNTSTSIPSTHAETALINEGGSPFTGHASESRKQQLLDIYNTPINASGAVDDWGRRAREKSETLYQQLQAENNSFDPYAPIEPGTYSVEPLTSTEKFFLEKINGKPIVNPDMPVYWFWEYNITLPGIMPRLMGCGYLRVLKIAEDVTRLKVDEMKAVLRNAGLPVTGKKAELLNRITDNISPEDLQVFTESYPKHYALTDKGRQAIEGLQKSMTKNHELEDACIETILTKNIQEAYRLICVYEAGKNGKRGIGIDWNREIDIGLSPTKRELYSTFMTTPLNSRLLVGELQFFEPQIKASVVLGVMMGGTAPDIALLTIRISGIREKENLIRLTYTLLFALMEGRLP